MFLILSDRGAIGAGWFGVSRSEKNLHSWPRLMQLAHDGRCSSHCYLLVVNSREMLGYGSSFWTLTFLLLQVWQPALVFLWARRGAFCLWEA